MRKIGYILIITFFLIGGNSFSQNLRTSSQSLEYISAHYDAVSNEVSIKMKDQNNVVKQFLYSPTDQSQLESILFNPINSLQGNSNVLTKPELIGLNYLVTFTYIGSGQDGSICCYKIQTITPQ